MKVLAMYLPQYHRVEENDVWWGEGFTDWVATKNASPLFEGHYQPHVPLDNNYYDLMEKGTMQWQAELLKKYSVDGICIYHYWFKDGRKILEKPAENLLSWKDIDLPFCFCWANETWARSWSCVSNKNVWANTYEEEADFSDNGILLEQNYGDEESWKDHFAYLLPFFKDERYIKISGHPVFMIYKIKDVHCLSEMIYLWNELSQQAGIKEPYIIGSGLGNETKHLNIDAKMTRQPADGLSMLYTNDMRLQNGVMVRQYDEVWEKILEEIPKEKTFFEGFIGYDDTPRRGFEGTVIVGGTPQKFEYYFTQLIAKSIAYGNELVFINAWNEWGEGMHLEPDEKDGEKYLEAIIRAKENYKTYLEQYKKEKKDSACNVSLIKLQQALDKNVEYIELLDRWMSLKEEGKSIVTWLSQKGYRSIAIYGYGILGRHLYRELEESDICIDYIIDQQRDKIHVASEIYALSDDFPQTNAVIVSATYYYDEILMQLKKKGVQKIVSLATILNEM